MPPKFTSRQLAFDAGPVPPFLQKLHAQVNGRGKARLADKFADDGGESSGTNDFERLLVGGSRDAAQSAKSHPVDRGQGIADDDEDDWAGAQVVVLKDGKHLSAAEASAGKHAADQPHSTNDEDLRMPSAGITGTTQGGAVAGPPPSARKRRPVDAGLENTSNSKRTKGGRQDLPDLDDVKALIAEGKADTTAPKRERDLTTAPGKDSKTARREDKNKRARAEKKRLGQGLSFSMDE